jgi:hypothetical protein
MDDLQGCLAMARPGLEPGHHDFQGAAGMPRQRTALPDPPLEPTADRQTAEAGLYVRLALRAPWGGTHGCAARAGTLALVPRRRTVKVDVGQTGR